VCTKLLTSSVLYENIVLAVYFEISFLAILLKPR